MINHVVLFKFKSYDKPEEKLAIMNEFKSELLALEEKISELKYIAVGFNFKLDAASFDVCLQTHFDSLEDLDAYRVHPEHVKVVKLVADHIVDRAAVDYPF